jgi:predicted transcriptional regulator
MVSKKPAKAEGLVRTVFYLPPEDRDAMAALAAQRRASESELYREAVARFLERESRPKK